jgi:hypothetical protein
VRKGGCGNCYLNRRSETGTYPAGLVAINVETVVSRKFVLLFLMIIDLRSDADTAGMGGYPVVALATVV